MAVVTDDWTPDEREAFCTLLARFNSALSDYHSTVVQSE
jgi:hypothetical protein